MEIWIIGGILVAIMIYASTRIKSAAKAAYEEEVIETETFRIIKPEGFLAPGIPKEPFVFEANSKDLGGISGSIPKARIEIRKMEDGDSKPIFESEALIGGDPVVVTQKVLKDGNLNIAYDLKIFVLKEEKAEYSEKIKRLIDSFEIIVL